MEGFLEAYLLTGRHGIWSSYESFVHVIDSMLNQHAKWLEATVREIPWRKPIASMNLLVSSHVWRQDHNGFSHQDPGVTSVLLNKCFHNDHVIGIYFASRCEHAAGHRREVLQVHQQDQRHHRW